MSTFGLYGKIIAKPGQHDALVAGLLEAAALMQHVPGCVLYIVNVSSAVAREVRNLIALRLVACISKPDLTRLSNQALARSE